MSGRNRSAEPLSFEGILYKLAYGIERYRLFGIPATIWCIVLAVALLVIMAWQGVALPLVLLVGLVGAVLVGTLFWARRKGYVRFVARPASRLRGYPQPLHLTDKIPLRATGVFEVHGMTRYLVDAEGLWQTFETRERVVMARISFKQLGLAQTAASDAGWWYTFFEPVMVTSVEPGLICHGSRCRRALRLMIQRDQNAQVEPLIVAFEGEELRERIVADLLVDAVDRLWE